MFKWLQSIGAAMYLLVAVSMLPALGILYYSGLETRQALQENSLREVRVLAENLASIQERVTASTRQLLSTLALALEDEDTLQQAERLLVRTLAENSRFANILLADPQGRVMASGRLADPQERDMASGRGFDAVNLSDRKYFQDALTRRRFSAGEYIVSRTTQLPAFSFSLPVYHADGSLKFVIVASLKLDGMEDLFRIGHLPQGSFIGLSDHAGLRLFRLPAGEGALPLGKPIANGVWKAANTSPDDGGAVILEGSDGVRRVMAFVRLRLEPGDPPYMFLFAGVPEEAITAQARGAVRRNLVLMALAAALALFTAWMASRWLFRPSVERLVRAARRFGSGDYSRPTGLDHGAGELGILAGALDQLASERSRAEAELKASQERYALVLRGANDGIWDWDLTTNQVYFSPRYKEILGFGPREMHDELEQWKIRVHPEDLERVMAENMRCVNGEVSTFQVRYRLRHKDGGYRWILGRGASLKDDSGRVIRMAGAHTDVTELVEAESALRASEQQFRGILESSPMGMHFYRLDDHDRLILVTANPASDRLLGIEHSRLIGKPIEEAFAGLKDGSIPELYRRVALGQEQARSFEIPYSDQHIAGVYEVVVFRTGERAAATLYTDITERLRIQELMVQTEKMMGVGGLAAGMAHEINNPLSGILQNVQVLARRLEEDLPGNMEAARRAGCGFEAVREYMRLRSVPESLAAIREAGNRASRIVSSMLQFSRKSESSPAPASLALVLENALDLCATDYDLKKKYDFRSIRIERRFDPELPPVPCMEVQIQQVFMNLLTNAAQAMVGRDDPTIRLGISREGGFARVDVEDNGPGFPEEVRRHVFEPFFTTKKVGEGTGLGLSVSYYIVVNHHGGLIEAERSSLGGARFTVRLPLAGKTEEVGGV